MYAAEQLDKEEPVAIMGLFDISQRYKPLANLLSLTMPYSRWAGLAEELDKSCLTTHSWRAIEKRM